VQAEDRLPPLDQRVIGDGSPHNRRRRPISSRMETIGLLEMTQSTAVAEPTQQDASLACSAELAIIVPTFNERENVPLLIARLKIALSGINWEVIFVDDDSADGTAAQIQDIARTYARVRCIKRIGRRGLSTACIEGVLATCSPFVAVMDADLQHDEKILPQMLELLRQDCCDVVVGSRYVAGGGVGNWDRNRAKASAFANWLSRITCRVEIADPMSGFFMLPRSAFDAAVRKISGQGFKILLDLLASSPQPIRVQEIPYQFGTRRFGRSKLDTLVAWQFVLLIADKLVGHIVPVRFALFAVIGGLGLFVHFATLWYCFKIALLTFDYSQSLATIVAMTSNFFLNNLFTYRDMRLSRWGLLRGLLLFYCICAVGAVANVGIASYIFAADQKWWLAGLVGVMIGAVWNYAVSSVFIWKR
jgi:dolichol-phosphate mannosyltransferase